MDPITLIVTALAAGSGEGALEALKDDVKDAIKAAYETLRGLVRNRVCDQPGAELVLARYEDEPGTWETPLAKMLHDTGAAVDANLLAVAHALLELVDAVGTAEGKYDVTISGSRASRSATTTSRSTASVPEIQAGGGRLADARREAAQRGDHPARLGW